MARSFDLANLAFKGRLAQQLEAWRDEGATLDIMAERLRAKGVSVSRETVRRWFRDEVAA